MRQDALLRPYRALHGRIFSGSGNGGSGNGSNGTNGSHGSNVGDGSNGANGSDAKTARKVRSVLFTASQVGEGCSTLAGNMAIYLTRAGPQRVLLLELDALHPARNPVVPAPRAAGVSDVLAGSATLEKAVHHVPGTNLFVLGSGTPREDAPELFSEPAMRELMKRLTSEYDYVVADGPTVSGVPRVDSLAPFFDGVALVTQANRTRRHVVARSVEALKGASDNFLGLVLNQRRFFIPAWIYGRL